MTLTDFLRTARRAQGLTLHALAQRVGISVNAAWEAEDGRAGMAVFDRLVEALGVEWAGLGRGATLAERIGYLRIQQGLSRAEVARRAGVSIGAAHRVELGRAHMRSVEAVVAVLAPHARTAKLKAWKAPHTRDVRLTPPAFLDALCAIVGPIDLDPCGHPASFVNARETYLADGLSRPWRARTAFCNPPYSEADRWLRRGFEAWRHGDSRTVILLLPVRSHTNCWQELTPCADVLLLKG